MLGYLIYLHVIFYNPKLEQKIFNSTLSLRRVMESCKDLDFIAYFIHGEPDKKAIYSWGGQ